MTEACQTHQRGEQSDAVFDRRVRGLEHRRADRGAMVELLEESSKKTVEKAVTAAASLPPMSECADVMALMGRARAARRSGSRRHTPSSGR